ncbi:hypothetical protein tloyanaT_13100 [Thalassotalea loyana]|uniref:DUF1320 domain-containing protein n=1 Tax=Thalassotalea loyana TaxID=280483 RepID=A0ABQ6HAA8_9GAMM|nr:phage protein Gp36 family protein [Thalassotalea loyana]GLX85058.1 hypothetical protein tloyanaT_13100 [Thalassotalea loyana]
MSYATVADLESRIGREELIILAPDESDPNNYSQAVIVKALEDASAEIDTYISAVHPLPLQEPPLALIRRCCDIARYTLMDDQPTDAAEKRYDQAVSYLKDIAKGLVNLQINDSTPAPTKSLVSVKRRQSDRTFTRDSLSGF